VRGDGQAIVVRLGIEHRLGNVGRDLAGSRRGEDFAGTIALGALPSDVASSRCRVAPVRSLDSIDRAACASVQVAGKV